MTKVIILAAGRGSRLKPYTDNKPKCLVKLGGISLLERQISALKSAHLNDITIVTGYKSELISSLGFKTIQNPIWDQTNMVASLWCAQSIMQEDIIISYSDIIFEPAVVEKLVSGKTDATVVIDKGFLDYWNFRCDDPISDLESLKLNPDGSIVSIGQQVKALSEIEGQYIGLMRFRNQGLTKLKTLLTSLESKKQFANMYLTDLLQLYIDNGHPLAACPIYHGWLETDTVEDLKKYAKGLENGDLEEFIKLDL